MRRSLYPEEDQTTLLEPSDFAKVVVKAVHKEYETGTHIVVRLKNMEELMKQ